MNTTVPRKKSEALAIIASVIGLFSLIPMLGLLSILSLLFSIIAIIRNASALAFVALVISLFSIATSPSVWILTGLGVGSAVISSASNSANASGEVRDTCGKEVKVQSKVVLNGVETCKINNVTISCDIYDTYSKDDFVLCDDTQQNILPQPTAESTQL